MDGTKGQVLTKQSETNGDANWEDIEANEVYIGKSEEAPSSAKIIVEEDDLVEGSTLSKAEVYVGAEEPTTGEKVWFRKGKNYLKLDINQTKNGVTIISNSDGSITLNGTATADTRFNIPIDVNLKAGTYTHSRNDITINNTFLSLDNINDTILRSGLKECTWEITNDTNYKQYVIWFGNGVTFDNTTLYLQLEQGLKTPYEDYIEQKIYVRNKNGVYEEFIKKSEEVYSTEETKIGTWIDGKPLYRKVINSTAPICEKDGTYVSKTYNISNNVDFAVIELGFIKDEYNQIQTFPYINNSGNCIKAFVDLNKKINLVHNINSYSSKEVTVSVEYTKTTD